MHKHAEQKYKLYKDTEEEEDDDDDKELSF